MIEMNVFKFYTGYKKNPINFFKYYIPDFFKRLKYAHQRATRGYCDYDVWDFDRYICELIADCLRDLAINTNSWDDHQYESFKDYQYDLLKNALKFKLGATLGIETFDVKRAWEPYIESLGNDILDLNKPLTPEQKAAKDKWLQAEKDFNEKQHKQIKEACEWLGEHMFTLWD